MADFITEMMKTAGVETHPMGCTNDDVNEYTNYISNDCEGDYEDCTWYDPDEYYPYFTAEKQLELIKLIALFDFEISIDIDKESTYLFATPNTLRGEQISVENDDFTQALAQLTTELMKAGELDKEKVKELLQ